MAIFKLNSNFAPAGDQPAAIEKLADSLKTGRRYQTLMGVTGSGKTFTMANVIAHFDRPALVISHNKTLAAQLYEEFKELFPENAVEYFVSYYDYYQPEAYIPQRDIYIEKDASKNADLDRLRLSATTSLSTRQDVIIVASVSCIFGLGSPEDYKASVVAVRSGESETFCSADLRICNIPETILIFSEANSASAAMWWNCILLMNLSPSGLNSSAMKYNQ